MNNKKTLFITSYPKSGNTFMRAIISSLIYSEDGIFETALFKKISLLDTNPFYDFVKKINAEDFLKLNQVDTVCKYWQLAQQKHSEITDNFIFKSHAANLMLGKYKYTSEENCMGVIYLVRDPRAVVPSYAYHYNITNDDAFQKITNMKEIIFNPQNNICVPLSNWEIHIKSWEKNNIPIIFVRFEDLVSDTVNTIYKCVEFLKSLNINFNYDKKKIDNIYQSTKFKRLKKLEEDNNYSIGKDKNFYRKGSIENNDVSQEIKNKLIDLFEEKMKKFNYI